VLGFQLVDVSVYYEVSVRLVQECEWHWRIFGEAPLGTFSLRLQHAVSPVTYPSHSLSERPTGQAGSHITWICLASVIADAVQGLQPHVMSLIL